MFVYKKINYDQVELVVSPQYKFTTPSTHNHNFCIRQNTKSWISEFKPLNDLTELKNIENWQLGKKNQVLNDRNFPNIYIFQFYKLSSTSIFRSVLTMCISRTFHDSLYHINLFYKTILQCNNCWNNLISKKNQTLKRSGHSFKWV